ncbi:AhpD family alkylhydroperoxidase [Geomicrobium halophilum]|uniref:AhpD family alkylhydroperoxidase n=1 Tax=Geomicrobium halophilum TaxID=549000 RepID=A0A841PW81_9BACL|nr:carboxymuconolactone decarboxylase family protein [Geomicrobium halophilum]MBB6448192.1 AhpD family alkylhydroperoxidase [Geomicrobium halophilum]
MDHQKGHAIEEQLMQYKEGIGKYRERMPELVHAYHTFTDICFQEGDVPQKYKQLAGLAISVHAQDEYCIIYHTKGCLDQGCTKEEISEIIGVATAMGGGAALSQGATLVQACIDQFME